MSLTSLDAIIQTTKNFNFQLSNEAFQPTKRPRTILSAASLTKKEGAPHAPEAPRRRTRRALTKVASPAGRTPSAASNGTGGGGNGGGNGSNGGNGGGGKGGGGDGRGGDSGDDDAGDGDPDNGDAGDKRATITVAHDLAYARVRDEIRAVRREDVRHITVNVPAASMLVLGALPKMRAMRQAIADEFANPPLEALDKLEDYAYAAALAHARVLPADEGATRVRELLNEATPLREHLLLNAASLASVGLFDAKKVAGIRQGSGHLDTARDLMSLGLLYLDAWPTIASKTPFGRGDVERAVELGKLLLAALGQRDQGTDGSGDPSEAVEELGKAFELFRRAYEWCRAAIVYLRRDEGDADLIAPPLASSRRRGRSAPVEEPSEVEPDTDEPGEGPPVDVATI